MVPFFVLADVFSPAHADRGLVSTRFLVSLPPEVFKQYLGQLGHAGLLERAPLSLQHAQWSASTTRTLEKLFNQLLTRSLLRYLLAVCFADDEQQQRIAAHAPTRHNFALLIGCSLYKSVEDHARALAARPVADDLIKGAYPAGDDEMCLEYYGFLIKQELLRHCLDKEVPEEHYPDSFAGLAADVAALRAKFARNKTDGFGGPEPEEQQEQQKQDEQDQQMQDEQEQQKQDEHDQRPAAVCRRRDEKAATKGWRVAAPTRVVARPGPVDEGIWQRNQAKHLDSEREHQFDFSRADSTAFDIKPKLGADFFLLRQYSVVEGQPEASQK
jgi:hypothetical protein